MTLLPGPCSTLTGAPEERLAELLARPSAVRSVHRPVVDLRDGRCAGYEASVRIAQWTARSAGPWFRAAARTGLSGQLGALALQTALLARATMPGDRFLSVELDLDAIAHPAVEEVLTHEDDVADLVISVLPPDAPPAASPPDRAVRTLDRARDRGLLLAMSAGRAGLDDLRGLEDLCPDLIRLPGDLIRGGRRRDGVRTRLLDVVVGLAAEFNAGTLAEDVETLDEAGALRSAGVTLAQGWLFGRARPGFTPPAGEVTAWLADQPRPGRPRPVS